MFGHWHDFLRHFDCVSSIHTLPTEPIRVPKYCMEREEVLMDRSVMYSTSYTSAMPGIMLSFNISNETIVILGITVMSSEASIITQANNE